MGKARLAIESVFFAAGALVLWVAGSVAVAYYKSTQYVPAMSADYQHVEKLQQRTSFGLINESQAIWFGITGFLLLAVGYGIVRTRITQNRRKSIF